MAFKDLSLKERLEHIAMGNYYAEDLDEAIARIAALEALLDECYESNRAPTSDELDRLKIPITAETKPDLSKLMMPELNAFMDDARSRIEAATSETIAKPESRECCPYCGAAPRNPCDYAYPHPTEKTGEKR